MNQFYAVLDSVGEDLVTESVTNVLVYVWLRVCVWVSTLKKKTLHMNSVVHNTVKRHISSLAYNSVNVNKPKPFLSVLIQIKCDSFPIYPYD